MTDLADLPRPAAPSSPKAAPPADPQAITPRFLQDVYQQASECNKCSLCQAVCPTYIVNPVEWETARGRVALIRDAIEGRIELRDIADGPLSTCLTCNNCMTACAPAVPTGEIVARARQELHDQQGQPWRETFALRAILPNPGALRFLHRLARLSQATGVDALLRRAGFTRWLGTVGGLMEQVGPLDKRTAYDRARDMPQPDRDAMRGRVGFLVCCYQNLADPAATESTMRVLTANGFAITVPEMGCSGLPAKNLGDRDAMLDMGVRNVTQLRDLDVDAFVGDVASCTSQYQHYDTMLGDDRIVGDDARRIARRVWHASAFLAEQGMTAELGTLRWTVTYDEPCQLPLDRKHRDAARTLLRAIPGLRLVELEESAMCCGGAGVYFHQQPERSEAILRRKFERIAATGADVLVTENVSCLTQLRDGARRYAPGVTVMHVFEVLDASIEAARRRAAAAAGVARRAPVGARSR
ncbi:MAG TPA: (Fe-S)-binding protein [Candidatus Dormibacteraeota bacterium]|jgi:glycolate oxidase iron-sulfur subunit|nr:(Fe-S)-binding protein [Candidatus Dormibacteraeota bacterium]